MTYLDARGLRCPLPLLKLKQSLHRMSVGEEITVETTDAGSLRDFQAFLRQSGHELLAQEDRGDHFYFRIRKQG